MITRLPIRGLRGLLVLGALIAQVATAAAVASPQPPSVAVAASLRPVMPSIVEAFRERTGQRVRLSFASTGKLTRQIMRGAPFQLLLAADSAYPQRLVEAGHTRGDGAVYAFGRLGLFVPEGSPIRPDPELAGLAEAVAAGRIERFAIANPSHAPYGQRTRAALRSAGLWDDLQPVLVLGDNAAQAAQFAASDSTAGGIIPASLAATPRLQRRGTFAALPEAWYQPLAHRMVLLDGAGAIANQLYRYMRTPAARSILREHGFGLPERP